MAQRHQVRQLLCNGVMPRAGLCRNAGCKGLANASLRLASAWLAFGERLRGLKWKNLHAAQVQMHIEVEVSARPQMAPQT